MGNRRTLTRKETKSKTAKIGISRFVDETLTVFSLPFQSKQLQHWHKKVFKNQSFTYFNINAEEAECQGQSFC